MDNVDSMLNNLKIKKLFDESYIDASELKVAKENLYNQTLQTEYLAKIHKGIKTILTIIVVILILNMLVVGVYLFMMLMA